MAVRVGFYHLQRWPLEKALPRLLERVLAQGHRALVMAGSPERVEALDALLWTYEPDSWLPHGTARGGDVELQPVFLTERDVNPNGADVLVLTDGAVSAHVGAFARCALLFDGNDPEALAAARRQWRDWKDAGYDLAYLQQTEEGGWVEKARSGPGGAGGDEAARA